MQWLVVLHAHARPHASADALTQAFTAPYAYPNKLPQPASNSIAVKSPFTASDAASDHLPNILAVGGPST